MESKSFIKLLRKVIREECRAAVRTELKSVLNENKSSSNDDISLRKMVDKPMVNKLKSKQTFSKNSVLNDLLNETATTAPSQEQMDWSKMNYKSEMAESFGNEQQPQLRPVVSSGINGEPVNMADDKIAASVNAMTKDYSSLMKAIDKKKGIK